MIHTVECWKCKTRVEIELDAGGYFKWRGGMKIQQALSQLTSDQRELLISKTCRVCWEKMFGKD